MDINPDSAFAVGLLKRKSLLGGALNKALEFTLRKADAVVVLDRWMQKTTVGHGAEVNKVVVIPPWAVFKKDSESLTAEINAFRRQHQLEDKFVILYSGNHSVVHPLDTLLEAAKQLKDHPEFLFLFIGAGLRTKDVADFKKVHGLSNVLQLPLQPRAKVKASFGSADLHAVVMGENMSGLVHTSKIYSVLASGKPFLFIGPERSHVTDLITESGLGKSVSHGEPSKVVEAIMETRAHSNMDRQKIYEKSLDWVNQFESESTLDKVYRRIILDVIDPREPDFYSKKGSLLSNLDCHWERTDNLSESTV
jgi:glycosyltransferase involved in cell wall biosynthesis